MKIAPPSIFVLERVCAKMDPAACLLLIVQHCSVHFRLPTAVTMAYVPTPSGSVPKLWRRRLPQEMSSNAKISLLCPILRIVPCRTIVLLPTIDAKMGYACYHCHSVR